ncbi:hypothetical protein BDP27DRAFT_1445946 [Rhodocollybia butyracea]|uniref:Uncharacterized protein n=1 Tax=Rhodocollybia butyracea TaxID=206335 RepID=A0A9P5UBB1_9AGAR|nr:hypothetical protein BDP27DRAFT_1447738 [Rhodocollybia butyracea]KAF9071928.1 hypothetical protein BDP27DRAFT_1445946 [Rhodocollybia butyracea]
MRTAAFPSLILYAIIAIATFNCVLAVAIKKRPSTKKSPSPKPEEIVIVAFDAEGKETGRVKTTNAPVQDSRNRFHAPGSTHGKFVTPFPGDCVLHIFKMNGQQEVDEERIEGHKPKETPFKYSHGVFNEMEVICYEYDG